MNSITNKPVAVACDHGGLQLAGAILAHLEENNIPAEFYGTHTAESCDYPDFAVQVTDAVTSGKSELGILVCGTGIGMSIAANKVRGIRAAVCGDTFSAEMTRRHNNANVLCLGQRVTGEGLALKIADIFLESPFEGGRHATRVEKLEK
ncbi:MAG: ribose 5-phosphate isomerase B [Oscillospiraceae bacterium]|jgi:ribose 5-phosphate isomerase B|nr:ribose 5-phosphate isomerase B [Oscillospiraceae bacterium]